MKYIPIAFRILTERIILGLLMISLWVLGIYIGGLGAAKYERIYVTALGSLWQILFVVIELSAGIWFFVALRRQLFPGGMKELMSEEMTFAAKVKYFPGIFALGVMIGIAGNGVVFFILEAISYLK
jgi:hypothetical protein